MTTRLRKFCKPLYALIVSAFLFALTGCTVHNHYYSTKHTPSATATDINHPGHQQLAEQLKGIHAAMEVVANNLANANTLAYKARRVTFHEGQPIPSISTDWSSGALVEGNSSLDLSVQGEGFFKIEILEEKGGGIAYTRAGNFVINRDGEIVLGFSDGQRLADGIMVPSEATSLEVSGDGVIAAILPDNSMVEIGQIELHRFLSPQNLERIGGGLYCETDASGPATSSSPGEGPMGTIIQGFLETSNVSFVSEMVELTMLTRWSNGIHQQLGLPTTALPPLDFPLQTRRDDQQFEAWLEQINRAPQAAP